MTEIFAAEGCAVIWADLMKFGRISGKDLDEVATRLKKTLTRKPSHTCAFVLAPYLVSERVVNGEWGQGRVKETSC